MIFDEDGSEAEHVAMDNIWALVQNNEYVFSQVFQPYDIFPGERRIRSSIFPSLPWRDTGK